MARSQKPGRRGEGRLTPFAAGAIAMVLAVVVVWLGFTKDIPFTHGYQVQAVFKNSGQIKKASPVRIAGVDVGKVHSIKRYKDSDLVAVTLEIKKNGLPIHKDATVAVRPRIFLEGNFFVDLKPGTPASPALHSGDTIPVTQTSNPVQLDQVLSALQSNTRADLQDLLEGYGRGLSQRPRAGEDNNQEPALRHLTGAEALRRATVPAPGALKGASIVNEALLGTKPHDLSKLIGSLAKVTRALNTREVELKDLITQFNTTMAATASESTALKAGIHALAPTLNVAYNTLGDVDAALPPTRALALELIPGVKETPATISAAFPWIRQVRGLVQPSELRGDAQALRKSAPNTAKLIDGTTRLLPQVDLIDRCSLNVVLPAGDIPVQDGPITAKRADGTTPENYKEFWYSLAGITGEGQNFDGNGMYVRFQPGGGLQTVSTGKASLSGDTLFAKAPVQPLGTRPRYPGAGRQPKFKPTVPCYTQQLPDVNGSADLGPSDAVVATQPPGTPTGLLQGLTTGIFPNQVTLPTVPVPVPPLPTLPPLPVRKKAPGATAPKAAAPALKTPATPTTPTTPSAPTAQNGPNTGPLGALTFGSGR